jgi:hypothetical protein
MMAATWGRPLPQWGGHRVSGFTKPKPSRSKAVRMKAPALSYQNIKVEVMAAIERMPGPKRAAIPIGGTLPEIIAAYALSQAGIPYQAQISTDGGRMRLGGSVVDMKVWLGSRIVIVRVMGDYWHSLKSRKLKDVVQFDRLHKYGYRVADLWEHDLYAAWAAGNIVSFVRDAVMGAT